MIKPKKSQFSIFHRVHDGLFSLPCSVNVVQTPKLGGKCAKANIVHSTEQCCSECKWEDRVAVDLMGPHPSTLSLSAWLAWLSSALLSKGRKCIMAQYAALLM